MEITSRYGKNFPEPKTVCSGDCEGLGVVPIFINKDLKLDCVIADEIDPQYIQLWEQAEKLKKTEDGWHFVKCLSCKGTSTK